MLLIVTQRGDYHADWVVLELHARGVPFLRFNTEDYPMAAGLDWSSSGEAYLSVRGERQALSQVDAVWYRRPVPPVMPPELPAPQAAWARGEAREALMGAWRTLDALWVNHPDRNRVAESKPLQLRVAAQLGFEVPESLVSNSREAVSAFLDAHPAAVICKPLYDGRVPVNGEEQLFFTSRVDTDTVSLRDLGPEPYLFQELIPKVCDIRATVIGEQVFAARIESQRNEHTQTDWRRGHPGELAHAPTELPDDVSERCVALCRRFGLHFGAIDLARRADGGYTFFEINPNGQWAWVEQRTGLPLRSHMVDLLTAGGGSHA
jgi:glutathione synthase/RimK-type ligase-like ATP-grasp enzyme